MLREIQITDTLGFVSVKDSLFGESDRYKSMMNIPIKGVDAIFSMEADIIDKNGYQSQSLKSVLKNIVLFDQDKNLLKQENKELDVDGVNGNSIVLGSLVEVSTSGNWPTLYDAGVIINNQESKSLNLSIFVSINGISFFTYNPVNFKASEYEVLSRPQKLKIYTH